VILGAHESIAGGMARSLERAGKDGCASLQVFTKNSNQWAGKPLADPDVRAFRKGVREAGLRVIAHDSYLINLASPDDALFERSVEAFADELRRCAVLRIRWLVMHPGSPLSAGEEFGLERVAAGIDTAFARAEVRGVGVLLENTAGQGRHLGWNFGQLAAILSLARSRRRLGICFDTQHAFAAGYDFRTRPGYRRMWAEFDSEIGLGRLKAFHLNDSRKELGCRVDRHAGIGDGHLGLDPFRMLVRDARFRGTIAVLETPPLADGSMSFARGLKILCGLEKDSPASLR